MCLRPCIPGLLAIALCGLAAGAQAQGSAAGDRAALMALYDATGGPSWSDNTNWGSDAPLNQWFGVTIDVDGRVAALILTQNGLVGPLPGKLGGLTKLLSLSFAGNNLTGPLPAELESLVNLTELFLSGNSLTGPIAVLGELVSLQRVSVASNTFSGPIPATLGELADLDELNLNFNRLTGPIPASLGNLTKLTGLGLAGNALTGPIPASLGNLANLEYLVLDNAGTLSGHVPSTFGNLQSLRFLWMQGNQLEGELPANLTSLSLAGLFQYINQPTLRFEDNAGLCAPADDAFQAWLDALPFGYTGLVCGAAVPAVPAVGLMLLALLLAGAGAYARRSA